MHGGRERSLSVTRLLSPRGLRKREGRAKRPLIIITMGLLCLVAAQGALLLGMSGVPLRTAPARVARMAPITACAPIASPSDPAPRARGPTLPKLSPAAKSVLTKLAALPSTRAAPVDIVGLGRLVRSSTDALHGLVLLQVLLALKADGSWRLAMALASLIEGAGPAATAPDLLARGQRALDNPTLAPEPTSHGDLEEDEDEDDKEFRRQVASSPNFVGGEAAKTEDAQYAEMARLMGMEGAKPPAGGEVRVAPSAAPEELQELLPVDTMHYNVLIDMCAAQRRWREALGLLERMRDRRVPRDTVTYNSLLKALHRSGRSKLAMKLFKRMRAEQVPPNTITFATAIAAAGRERDSRQALELLELAVESGTPRNTIVYSAAISACEKAGEWQSALELLERMHKDDVDADVPLLNAATAACARGGNAEGAEAILRNEFARCGLEPDRITYNSVVSAWSRAKPEAQPEKGREIIAEMQRIGGDVAPDTVSYNALLHGFSRAHDKEAALNVLRTELPAANLRPDVVTYTTALDACNATQDWRSALELVREAEESRVELGTLAYSKAIGALSQGRKWREACELLSRISKRDLPHNPRTVNLALAACADGAPDEDDAAEAAGAALSALREVLAVNKRGSSKVVPGPPVDGSTVELTKQLLVNAPLDERDEAELLANIETATLKMKRPRRPQDYQEFKSKLNRGKRRGRGGRGGQGGRGRGRDSRNLVTSEGYRFRG